MPRKYGIKIKKMILVYYVWSTVLMCRMETLLWWRLLLMVAQPLHNTWLREQQLKLMPQIMWVIVTVYSVLLYMYIGYLWINTSIIDRNWVIELALIIQYMWISNELIFQHVCQKATQWYYYVFQTKYWTLWLFCIYKLILVFTSTAYRVLALSVYQII